MISLASLYADLEDLVEPFEQDGPELIFLISLRDCGMGKLVESVATSLGEPVAAREQLTSCSHWSLLIFFSTFKCFSTCRLYAFLSIFTLSSSSSSANFFSLDCCCCCMVEVEACWEVLLLLRSCRGGIRTR